MQFRAGKVNRTILNGNVFLVWMIVLLSCHLHWASSALSWRVCRPIVTCNTCDLMHRTWQGVSPVRHIGFTHLCEPAPQPKFKKCNWSLNRSMPARVQMLHCRAGQLWPCPLALAALSSETGSRTIRHYQTLCCKGHWSSQRLESRSAFHSLSLSGLQLLW